MWTNWSTLESANPTRTAAPTSVDAIVAEVARAREARSLVKMVGSSHSFTGIASPDNGTQLLPGGLRGLISIDEDALTATAWAGTQLKALNAELEARGYSLHNMGDIAEQTLAGATQTGTHGSGGIVAGIAAQIAALQLVSGTGEVLNCSPTENAEVFEHARVGLGALGIVTQLTFRIEPLFALEAHEAPLGWDEFFDNFDAMVEDANHVDAYWFPHTDRFSAKRNYRIDVDEAKPLTPFQAWFGDHLMQNTLFGTLTEIGHRAPKIVPRINRVEASAMSPRHYSDVAHKVFTTERTVRFKEMEYALPRADGLEVLKECRRAIDRSGLNISFPVEVRTARADELPLSTASGRDSLYLAFHTYYKDDHRPYFNLIEPILKAAAGRPHWGKWNTRAAADLAPIYPRFEDFLAVRNRLDPDRVFANAYLRRVLGD